jgi:hypothetical protein
MTMPRVIDPSPSPYLHARFGPIKHRPDLNHGILLGPCKSCPSKFSPNFYPHDTVQPLASVLFFVSCSLSPWLIDVSPKQSPQTQQAYIAISLDHTGLIRWLAVWVLKKGGGSGRLLYFFLYLFYFGLGTLFGNDPIILSGTPFIAYMTKASRNIKNPRAWIFAQFACANVGASNTLT